ncbi:glycoside hydrolase family 9 protein [Paenibacillus thermotolerans]|uniref:glycoside hydrolase family 9 protein n=1 Tax=Paenibacillus thermotolerans TaxID=3027807 RepID=UPI002368DB82|nr:MULTISPECIES: glycoside hydrolase family 9 protein [unclassified Paenibacillus]
MEKAAANGNVHINQIGYRAKDRKRFIVNGAEGPFEVIDASTGQAVYAGLTRSKPFDPISGDTPAEGDFGDLRKEGVYYIRTAAGDTSHPFEISERPYRSLNHALLKSFYFQRCGTELEERYAGPWGHKACHLAEGLVHGAGNERLPSCGGWHDAGDYGKYTVPAAKAIADLLLAFECFPGVFEDEIRIPESGNGIPDILNEVKYELEWLFKMQRDSDGAVFHKVTTRRFPGLDVMPEDDTAELVFSPVSATAAGTFAAATAMASRMYKPFDAAFAERCLAAAERAWKRLETEPSAAGFKNPPEISTGEYGDRMTEDERYWAAAELYRATGGDAYRRSAAELAASGGFPLYELGWANVGGYGTLALLLAADESDEQAERLKAGWLEQADAIAAQGQSDGYGVALAESDYIWGSNMIVMNRAMQLIFAHRFAGDGKYADAALNQWHYLLGVNALDVCYVTGFGGSPVRRPHHRPSVGDGVEEPVPGMVAGGPNKNLQDEQAKAQLQGQPPARCFLDHIDSYSTNEMAIYWNSPAVFVGAFFDGSDNR